MMASRSAAKQDEVYLNKKKRQVVVPHLDKVILPKPQKNTSRHELGYWLLDILV